jgi:hypothetical protein
MKTGGKLADCLVCLLQAPMIVSYRQALYKVKDASVGHNLSRSSFCCGLDTEQCSFSKCTERSVRREVRDSMS